MYYSQFQQRIDNRLREEEERERLRAEEAAKEAEMKLVDPAVLSNHLVLAKENMTKDPLKPAVLELLMSLWHRSSQEYVGSL